MGDQKEEEIIEGKVKDRNINLKEKKLLEWAEKSWENNLNTFNEVLKLLLNINLPLFSGLIVFFKYIGVYCQEYWYLPFVFLGISFISSLVGIFPCTQEINLINVTQIEKFRNKTLKRKRGSMIISIVFLFISLLVIIYLIL